MGAYPDREAHHTIRIVRADDFPDGWEVPEGDDGFGGYGPTEYPTWCVLVEMFPGLEMRPGSDAYARTTVTVKDGRWHVLKHEVTLKGDAATDSNLHSRQLSKKEALRLVRDTVEHECSTHCSGRARLSRRAWNLS